MLNVKYVVGDDWEGIYVNNTLVEEGHRIRFRDGFEVICEYINGLEGLDSIQFSSYDVDQDWLEDNCGLPKKFEDIPNDMLDEWS